MRGFPDSLAITTAVDGLNSRTVHNKVCVYAPIQQSHPTVRTSGKLAVGRYRSRRLIVTERKRIMGRVGRDGIYVCQCVCNKYVCQYVCNNRAWR